MSISQYLIALVGGFLAGLINAVAGGGTLVSFPILLSIGLRPIDANITNTVSLVLGYAGGAYSQRSALGNFRGKLTTWIIVAGLGGIFGSFLLKLMPEKVFESIVPLLIFIACALLACQGFLKRLIFTKAHRSTGRGLLILLPIFLSATYGGYFGAGLGIILISILGLTFSEGIKEINSLKAVLSFAINICAASFLIFSGNIHWDLVFIMSISSLTGGLIGGKIVHRIRPEILKALLIVFGIAVGIKMLTNI